MRWTAIAISPSVTSEPWPSAAAIARPPYPRTTPSPAPMPASTLTVSAFPSPTTDGTAGSSTGTAKDAYGNIATGYKGTVKISSSDALASLPANYTFASTDAGVHSFPATLNTVGTQSITSTD